MARGRRARLRAFDIPQQIPPRMAQRFGLSSFPTTKKAEVFSTSQKLQNVGMAHKTFEEIGRLPG
jgi:hypothetical protein